MSKTSFQFAARREKDSKVSLGKTSNLMVSPEKAERVGPTLKGNIIRWAWGTVAGRKTISLRLALAP